MKNVFLVATIAMLTEKVLFPISMATIVREAKFLHEIKQLINQTIPEKLKSNR